MKALLVTILVFIAVLGAFADRVQYVSPELSSYDGKITVRNVFGSGKPATTDSPGLIGEVDNPTGLIWDHNEQFLYVTDMNGGGLIRKLIAVDPSTIAKERFGYKFNTSKTQVFMAVGTAFAGTNMQYIYAMQMSPNGDKVYITSENFHNLRSVETVHEFDPGYDSSANIAGSPSLQAGGCVSSSTRSENTCKGNANGIGSNARFENLLGMALQYDVANARDANIFLADCRNNAIKRVDLATNEVTTFHAGWETRGFPIMRTGGMTFDTTYTKLYVAVIGAIKVFSNLELTTTTYVAGGSVTLDYFVGFSAPTGSVASALGIIDGYGANTIPGIGPRFQQISFMTVDEKDNLYISDVDPNKANDPSAGVVTVDNIRRITPQGNVTTLLGKTPCDHGDDQYITDTAFWCVKKGWNSGTNEGKIYGGDLVAGPEAQANLPQGLAVTRAGNNLFFADKYNNLIRQVGCEAGYNLSFGECVTATSRPTPEPTFQPSRPTSEPTFQPSFMFFNCPEGYTADPTSGDTEPMNCYSIITGGNSWTWYDAKAACEQSSNGWLVTITSQLENEYLSSKVDGMNVWIGLNDIEVEGIFVWLRGGNGFTNWGSGEPNNFNDEDCGQLYGLFGGYLNWNDCLCYDPNCGNVRGYICQTCPLGTYSATGTSPVCQPCPIDTFSNNAGASACTPCPSGYFTDGMTGSTACTVLVPTVVAACPSGYTADPNIPVNCYFLVKSLNPWTWYDAKELCELRSNGWLATITSQTENEYLQSQINGGNVWIGINDIAIEGTYTWLRGGNAFAKWSSGEPNNGIDRKQDCGYMDSAGDWYDCGCNDPTDDCFNRGYICQTCPLGTYIATGTSPVCRACPVDTFSKNAGASACTPCPSGYFTDGMAGSSACTSVPSTAVVCPDGYTSDPSIPVNCYSIVTTSSVVSWYDAKSVCEQNNNGWLATITSQAENDYLTSKFSIKVNVWIGLNDVAEEGTFAWLRGGNNFTHWSVPPNNQDGDENCVELVLSDVWNDCNCAYCGANRGYICQTCPLGTYSARGTSPVCQPCPVDTFSNNAGASACTPCPSGYFTDGMTGSSTCVNSFCKVNKYSSTGREPCLPCPEGSFNDIVGSTSCRCKAGYFGKDGTTPCVKCLRHYSSVPGAANCYPCIGFGCTADFDMNVYLEALAWDGLPTRRPTRAPTQPTLYPTLAPTGSPSHFPTDSPSDIPTVSPTRLPTQKPTSIPSDPPSCFPTDTPTGSTELPTPLTRKPSRSPTLQPSPLPTASSMQPTPTPTNVPSIRPSTPSPLTSPSKSPTSSPSESSKPSVSPSRSPTSASCSPTRSPTDRPA